MPAKGKHRRPKSLALGRGFVAAGTGGAAALALPLLGATSAHAAAPAAAPAAPQQLAQAVQAAQVAAQSTEAKRAAKPAPRVYTVVAGDYLAKIAHNKNVKGGWKKLYADNRQVIGDDPSLIHPGLKLTLGAKNSAKYGAEKKAAPKAAAKAAPKPKAKPKAAAETRASRSAAKTTAPAKATAPAASGYTSPVAAGVTTLVPRLRLHVVLRLPHRCRLRRRLRQHREGRRPRHRGLRGLERRLRQRGRHQAHRRQLLAVRPPLLLSVSAGQTVSGGQQIGLSGSTGNSTGPHLHFEIRTAPGYGSDIDPLAYLRSHGVSI